MTLDNVLKAGNILGWVVAALVFYFTSQGETSATVFKTSERISVLEQRIQQEAVGYSVLQSSLTRRLDRIEQKVDCLIDRRLCH